MSTLSDNVTKRLHQMLNTAFGDTISRALLDDNVTEILVNPDGCLWIETGAKGRIKSQYKIRSSETERIIRLVASSLHVDISVPSSIVSAELPGTGERFEGLLPPVALAPLFAIRKPIKTTLSLDDYLRDGIISLEQKKEIEKAISERLNILVVGGTGSGKTTLVNALLSEVAATGDRVILLEDTRELQCPVADCVALRTRPPYISLNDLVRSSLRLRPDRIIVGEVRGAEAYAMLKSWNTGHPGGISTLHANSAISALHRLEQLVQEAIPVVPRNLIADTIDMVLFISGKGAERTLKELIIVKGLDDAGNYYLSSTKECSQ